MIKVKFLIREKTISDKEVKIMSAKKKESKKLNVFQKLSRVSREFHEIHFPAREKVQEEALAIVAASAAVSAVIFAVDTVSWQILQVLL